MGLTSGGLGHFVPQRLDVKMKTPQSYEEWLALSDLEKDEVHQSWNAYEREGYGFPATAAGRLAISSEVRVLQSFVGTYHGGEYLLHMYVSDGDYPKMPARLEQTFEGFRVIWLPESHL